jgi:hypothetical protein
LPSEQAIAPRVRVLAHRVRAAVDLDDQPRLRREEVGDVPDRKAALVPSADDALRTVL